MSYTRNGRGFGGLSDPCPVAAGAANAEGCVSPTPCPPVPDLICVRSVSGIPFEYVAGRIVLNSATRLYETRNTMTNRQQRFRPVVQRALERFVQLMNQYGMPFDAFYTMGSLVCRCMRNTNTPSNHSWGEAIDLTGVRWRPGRGPSRFHETIIHNHGRDAAETNIIRRMNACLRLAFPLVIDYHRADHKDHFHCDTNRGRGRFIGETSNTTWWFAQEMLGVILRRPIPTDGRRSSTIQALADFAQVPVASFRDPAAVHAALDRLYTHVASGAAFAGAAPVAPQPPRAPLPVAPVPTPTPARAPRNDVGLVRESIARGITGLNQLTDVVFHVHHPELRGRKIGTDEKALAREWLDIRERIVRPLLPRATPTRPMAPRAPISPAPGTALAISGLGAVVARIPGRPEFRYQFTSEDALWTARMLEGEAGGRDDADNAAVLWAMINRYAFFTHRNYPTFQQFIRAYSTPLQAVLNSWRAAKRHMNSPDFERTGATYPPPAPPGIAKGRLRQHRILQAKPWEQLSAGARALTLRVMRGQQPNPIRTASEFASTRIIFRDQHGRFPNEVEWRAYTRTFKNKQGFVWIGDVAGLNQLKNAFFTRSNRVRPNDPASPRFADLPADTVRISAPAPVR